MVPKANGVAVCRAKTNPGGVEETLDGPYPVRQEIPGYAMRFQTYTGVLMLLELAACSGFSWPPSAQKSTEQQIPANPPPVAPAPPPSAPGAIAIFSVGGGNAQNIIFYETVAGATGYRIYYSIAPGVTTASGTMIMSGAPPYVHTGLTNGMNYYYIMAAENSGILGPTTVEILATPKVARYVFATSSVYLGNMGGISAADTACATLAVVGGLTGYFRAYLSTLADDAACRVMGLQGQVASNCGLSYVPDQTFFGPYDNRNNLNLNNNLYNLVQGNAPSPATCGAGGVSLYNPIDRDESNNLVGGNTFTATQCGTRQGATTCGDWTLNTGSTQGGQTATTQSWWSASATETCATPLRIYCFEVR